MFCPKCGSQITDGVNTCPSCGAQINATGAAPVVDDANIAWGILGFFVPVAGLVIFLMWKDQKPKTAKLAGKGALISVILEVVVGILCTVVGCLLTAVAAGSSGI